MTTDVAAYLNRIGYTGSTEPTVDTLRGLVAGHNRSIPFENLDPLLGVPVADLSAKALTDKLVHRRRGGYCYEQNGLLGYVLADLGFGVDRLAGRVVWMNPSGALPAQTHETLSVQVPGDDGRWLVDVGFGGQTLSSPIRLEEGPAQHTRHEPYRLRHHDDGFVLEAEIRGEWQPLYAFETRPIPQIDLEVGSWYVSTHPESIFVTGLSVSRVTDDARHNLRGRHLAVHRGGTTERIRFDTAAEVLTALTERFGINIDDLGERAVLEARVAEVLDT
ncbi:arylamine N-acetyltransferase [Mycolicibacterium flavescens]|uniref:Arylamine N-acetyltransferase n=1 Tax=Mycolicibacterium flavescens TaxID=1776 RepID=A0A1E3RP53_MYCFV|nr:arylamine N-acetyltransferase [Mycolicibacterium flavescens]MCV7281610.1 arylamine N-acetyltransferase [Mycolicibacterium flavescens]ODQ91640.1 arylamine N-acetyltransferase [Mycolicibacterium flavescens]